jgi:hypothetical protein
MLQSNTSDVNQECIIPDQIDQQGKKIITEKINKFCSGNSAWKTLKETEQEALNREFNTLAESHFADTSDETEQRIYKTMLSLWQNTQLFSLEKSKRN